MDIENHLYPIPINRQLHIIPSNDYDDYYYTDQ